MKKLVFIKSLCLYTLLFCCIPQLALAFDKPAIENYGLLPENRSFTISPDGKHYAFIKRIDSDDYLAVINTASGEMVAAANTSEVKARRAEFITNKYVILHVSETVKYSFRVGAWESSFAFSLNIETGDLKYLLSGTRNLHPFQTGVGKIVGFNAEKNQVYMPAYDSSGVYNLYGVSLGTQKGHIQQRGKTDTRQWFVDNAGEILAREDYSKDGHQHRIYSKISGSWVKIYSKKTRNPLWFRGVSPDGDKLLYTTNLDDKLYSMDLESGKISEAIQGWSGITSLVTDINRTLMGVKYGGFKEEYDFIEPLKTESFSHLSASFPMSNVEYLGSTSDNSKIMYKISGPEGAGLYGVFYPQKNKVEHVASEYPNVSQIAEPKAVTYKARDGLNIPSVITFPTDTSERKNLPLIVMPHQGPEEYDGLKFDWMAQYFAHLGYAVLQPNFRGSTGFGLELIKAGHGKWGREMQDDVTDGVHAMVEAGYVDPERVCIVGAAYGGYSALAGGAFSPELYRCVVSIAGVSDLPKMLEEERWHYGNNHWVIGYWRKIIDDSKIEKDELNDISPVNFADRFQAPVLLIHGKDDTVVPLRQSILMRKALEKAKKPVELVTLTGEDHWLSTSETRLALLESMSEFIQRHNPPD